jgi:chromosome segregation ATPase
MKEELHLALRALEKNLKDIQAANETVKEVRVKAAEDIQAASKVIQRINAEIDEIDEHFKNWLSSFDDSTKNTFKGFEAKANESVKKMTALNEALKSQLDSNIESFSESNRLLFQKYESAWGKHNQELDRVFLKFEELKQTIEGLKSQIREVDFPAKLNKIFEGISGLEEVQESQTNKIQEGIDKQGSNFTILAVIGAVIIVLQVVSFFIK